MIPTPRLIGLVVALGLSAAALAYWPALRSMWLILPLALLILAGIDFYRVRKIELSASRTIRQVMSHGQWSDVSLQLSNPHSGAVHVQIHDMHPQLCRVRGLPIKQTLNANAQHNLNYEALPEVRGDMVFDGVDCLIKTGMGLWHRQSKIECKNEVKVYPNFSNNALFGLLLSKRTMSHLGIRRLPRPGEGSDFHQLREYRDGDSLRQIDWKATARMRKPISREYTQERDQQIVFLLDCSMRMRHQDDKASHMDETLNAIVLLAHVALQQGDATGIMTFGGIDRWIPPSKGLQSARRLMHGLYDLEATRELPDYVQAVETLATRLKRRALIILITNMRNEDGQSALQALQRIKSKHLVLLADLRESDLELATSTQPETADEAILWLSAEQYNLKRKQQHRLAVAGGARLLDVTPGRLSADLITQYLTIKNLGKL